MLSLFLCFDFFFHHCKVYGWLEDLEAGKEELKYIITTSGELFVMIPGIYMTRKLFVASLDILVRLVLQDLPDSVLEVVKFGWMMLLARGVKVLFSIVGTMDGALITAPTEKMHR